VGPHSSRKLSGRRRLERVNEEQAILTKGACRGVSRAFRRC
jgi:hypothetical protein